MEVVVQPLMVELAATGESFLEFLLMTFLKLKVLLVVAVEPVGKLLLEETVVAVVAQKNERIGFVVPQQNIVLGLMLLDQVVLEDQRLRFGMRDGKLDGTDMAHQGSGLLAARIAPKIGAQTFGEILGLADVQDAACLIQHPIHTRLVWHGR